MAQKHGAERAKPAPVPEEEYQAIFEAVTDGLIISDLASGRIVEVNPVVLDVRLEALRADRLAAHQAHSGDHPLFTDFADIIQHGHEFRARARDMTKESAASRRWTGSVAVGIRRWTG